MTIDRWITNLESEHHLAGLVAKAEQELKDTKAAGKNTRFAQVNLERAKFYQRDVQNTWNKIRQEYPGCSIGVPRETAWKTSQQIAADGIVGIYRPGVGTGALNFESAITLPSLDPALLK